MRLSRQSRFVTAAVALFSLLFMQLAVAAYACPKFAPMTAQAVMLDASGAPMKDCPQVDKQSPSLCQADSNQAPQSLDKPPAPAVQAFVPTGLFVLLVIQDQSTVASGPPAESFLRAPGTSPPIAIRHCCFRL
jgi:hypothetical protein